MTEDVRIGLRGAHVLEIVLARPAAGNALSPAMADAIVGAIEAMAPDTRAVFSGPKASISAPAARRSCESRERARLRSTCAA